MPNSQCLLEPIRVVPRTDDAIFIHTKLVRHANSGQAVYGHGRGRCTIDVEDLFLTG